jgi:hypothetical protein
LVLAALVIGMTAVSAVLLVLEPGPMAPLSDITLLSTDRAIPPAQRLFNTPEPLRWQAIIVHDSGTMEGSALTIGAVHERLGKGGLGYHFVINNGTVEPDGTIEIGFRWQRQFIGDYLEGPDADWFNRHAIGICVIGDGDRAGFTDAQMRELLWLVRQLQQRFQIPRHVVYTQIGSESQSVSPHFPDVRFRSQLLNPR